MNITHVSFGFTTGGAELMMADIMAEQARAGHDVTLIVINRHYEQPLLDALDKRIRVVTLNRPEGSHNPLWLLRYNLVLRRTHPHIIHLHSSKAPGFTFNTPGAKIVMTVHDTGINLRHTKKLHQVFAISEAVHADLLQRLSRPSTVVENGITCSRISVKPTDEANDQSSGSFRIAVVARLMHQKKGQDIAIEALNLLKKSHPSRNVTLDFIGEGSSEQHLRALAETHGLSASINFLGNRSRDYIYSHLCDYDLFLLPSRYEGFGLTVAEAMAAKVPVLVSDIEGPMEVIGNGRFGSHFRCGDPGDCAAAIARIIADYPRHLALARNDAYRHVTERYDISRTAADYLRHYAELT